MKNSTGGRGTNLTDADRKKGGEHSHGSQGSQKSGHGSSVSDADRKKSGSSSHKK